MPLNDLLCNFSGASESTGTQEKVLFRRVGTAFRVDLWKAHIQMQPQRDEIPEECDEPVDERRSMAAQNSPVLLTWALGREHEQSIDRVALAARQATLDDTVMASSRLERGYDNL
jgi:hypothetical protein